MDDINLGEFIGEIRSDIQHIKTSLSTMDKSIDKRIDSRMNYWIVSGLKFGIPSGSLVALIAYIIKQVRG